MNVTQYKDLVERFTAFRTKITDAKRPDYTVGSEDVLKNFKAVAERTGMTPLQVAGVYYLKHIDALCAYIKNPDAPTSEPIWGRLADIANYTELIAGIIAERGEKQAPLES